MIIDLSVLVNANTPVYPGDPEPKIKPVGRLDKDGFCDHQLVLGTHVGTHIDAPMHMIKGGESLDKISIDTFVGTGKLVDINSDNFSEALGVEFSQDDIILFNTGKSEIFHNPSYFEQYPAMTSEVADHIIKSGVKMVGVDTCSVDNKEGFPIHKMLLQHGILIIENLTNLSKLSGQSFKVYALPLNLTVDGSPARVIAETSNT